MLGAAYRRSRAGQRAGAWKPSATRRETPVDPAALTRFVQSHRPVWLWLLAHAEITLAVDPERTHIVWAWLVTSEHVIHAVGCKESVVKAGLSEDIVRDLLGERLRRHQVCSLELPQMRARGGGAIGIDRPREWSLDPTWLLTRMGEMRSAA